VEVNGVNVANENHKQVVERIKTVRDETRLLVVDSQTDAWFREQRIVIRGALKNVIYLQNPATRTRKFSSLSIFSQKSGQQIFFCCNVALLSPNQVLINLICQGKKLSENRLTQRKDCIFGHYEFLPN
jgi:hypothetical protein